MSRSRAVRWQLLVAVLLVGCSDSGDDGPLSPDGFLARYAAIRCEQVEACCRADGVAFDEGSCLEDPRFGIPGPEYQFLYDESAARRCLAELRASRDGCGRPDRETTASCYDVIRPTAAPGAPCIRSEECVALPDGTPVSCLPEAPGASRVCFVPGAPVRAAAGEPCGESCSGNAGEEFCARQFANRGVCHASDGLFCSYETGRCEPFRDVGEACERSGIASCREDLYCSYESGACRPRSEIGEPCAGSDGDGCVGGASCEVAECESISSDVASVADCTYRCVPPLGEGDPCAEPGPGRNCPYPLSCSPETHTCASRRPEGAPCRDDTQCDFGTFCDPATAICHGPGDTGDACARDRECLSGRCTADPGGEDFFATPATSDVGQGTCLEPPRVHPYECRPPPEPTQTPSDAS